MFLVHPSRNCDDHIITARNSHIISIVDSERGTISAGALADADDSNSSAVRTLPKVTTQLVQNVDEDGSATVPNASGYLDVSGCLVTNERQ